MPVARHTRALGRTAGLATGAFLAALMPAGPAAAGGLAHLAAATTTDLYVAVVVDFGGLGGAPKPFATCVHVAQGSTDADALAAAVGSGNIGYAPSGLLCTIDGYPANGIANCNATSGTDFYYWSYWGGTSSSWSYSSRGPASTLVTPGDVEGWRYQNPGPSNGSAPPPSLPADFSAVCPSEYVASTGAPATPPTATTTPVTSHGTAPPITSKGAGANAAAGTKATPPGATAGNGAALGAPAPASASHTASRGPPATTSATTTTTRPPDVHQPDTDHRGARALGVVPHPSSPGTDWPVAAVVAALVIGLGVLATLRWRRRAGGP
jgi:hypothetical protein